MTWTDQQRSAAREGNLQGIPEGFAAGGGAAQQQHQRMGEEHSPEPDMQRTATSDSDRMHRYVAEYLREETHDREGLHAPRPSCCGTALTPRTARRVAKAAWTALSIGLMVRYAVQAPDKAWLYLPLYRWWLLSACIFPIWYVPRVAIFLLVVLLESQPSLLGGNTVYYLIGVRVHLTRLCRVAAAQVLTQLVAARYVDPDYKSTWGGVMKAWTCLTLLFTANCLKALLARLMSRHFHTRGYFERMQEAEHLLVALSRPCPGRTDSAALTHLGLAYGTGQQLASLLGALGPISGKGGKGGRGSGGGGSGGGGSSLGRASAPQAADQQQQQQQPQYGAREGAAGGAEEGEQAPLLGSAGAGGSSQSSSAAMQSSSAAMQSSSVRMVHHSSSTPDLTTTSPFAPLSTSVLPLHRAGGGAAAAAAAAAAHTPYQQHNQHQQQLQHQGQGAWQRLRLAWLNATLMHETSRADAKGIKMPPMFMASTHPSTITTQPSAAGGLGGGSAGGVNAGGSSGSIKAQASLQHAPSCAPQAASASLSAAAAEAAVAQQHSLRAHSAAQGQSAHRQQQQQQQQFEQQQQQYHQQPRVSGSGAAGGGVGTGGAGGIHSGIGGSGSTLDLKRLQSSLYWLERHIRHNKLKLTLTEQLGEAAEAEESEISSKREAKRLAFFTFWNVLGGNKSRSFIVARDLEPFLASPSEVKEAFVLFDSDGDGRITLANMTDTIIAIYKERKKLALTLADTRSVVGKLELICGVALHVMFAFSYLVIFQVNIHELWLTISSVSLAFVFVFGNSLRNLYESVIFLFVVHPFDVGDYLQLASGDVVKVEEIALLSTTFLKADGRRLYYPNPKLITEPCINLSRSDNFWDNIVLLLDCGAPVTLLERLEVRLKRFISEHPREFTGAVGVVTRGVEPVNKLRVVCFWEFAHTGEEAQRTNKWRSRLLMELSAELDATGVVYTMPPQTVTHEAPFAGLSQTTAAAAAAGGSAGGAGSTASAAQGLRFRALATRAAGEGPGAAGGAGGAAGGGGDAAGSGISGGGIALGISGLAQGAVLDPGPFS